MRTFFVVLVCLWVVLHCLIIGALSVLASLPLDTGFGILPLPMHYPIILSALAFIFVMTGVYVQKSDSVRKALSGFCAFVGIVSLILSFYYYTSVLVPDDYYWPTPTNQRVLSIALSVLLFVPVIVYWVMPGRTGGAGLVHERHGFGSR